MASSAVELLLDHDAHAKASSPWSATEFPACELECVAIRTLNVCDATPLTSPNHSGSANWIRSIDDEIGAKSSRRMRLCSGSAS